MPDYREKLWPNAWAFIVTALVIPASILVLVPISLFAGIVTAAVLYGGCVLLLVLASPVVRVQNGELIAGPATISTTLLGQATVFDGAEATQERGPRLDARAWLLIRGWIKPVVRVPIVDATDPAPYWVISSRHPIELAAAINESRTANVG
ncbi:Protein of unknown function [Cryobacterium flavum]|uniref:DUF3093 domain-containing protein n=1 Tax=Cryobacterium flavum TaxID=1424659 RepID=A0A4R8UY87_9MICO|nr:MULTISPECIES: DUF3093 domain-containing protein [Cryobacterium]TFB74520.1 DUF3093 domain-containing protein [Cryobacterium flavum]TFD09230.1 DUF3093 domain-containing protein [Cryobacterium sp. TMT1-66-1]TFD14962.1 DUF3093 domain-containing protein [Cryobacterium sp. TMT1-2-2]SDN19460.1 Protein of unknown function [Cryobacterium flavum]